MVIETGKPIAEVARDLNIHDGTLGKRHLLHSGVGGHGILNAYGHVLER
jgi:transposase-like protein